MRKTDKIKNLDYMAYKTTVQGHKNYQTDWVKKGYAPLNFYVKDFSLVEVEGTYHLFHIAGTPGASCVLPGNEIWFGHATTKDFQTWKTHEPCLYIDTNSSWENGHLFAPFVLQTGKSNFTMFYTGATIDNTQRIGLATSSDLMNWKRPNKRPIIDPSNYDWTFCPKSGGAACRDPHVSKFNGKYHLYYTAVTKNGKGCVALAVSKNLTEWVDKGPVFVLKKGGHCESSNVQVIDGKYYLFFGGHGKNWSYVVSDSPEKWSEQPLKSLGEGITAMEVIKKKNNKWLVAFFRQNIKPFHDGCRLFLGSIDWNDKQPQIRQISEANELKEWF